MSKYLIFDTETTGLLNYRLPGDDPSQPHIVQLAAILCDDDKRTFGSIDLTIAPDGWTIPDEISKIHGITTDQAKEFGVPIEAAMAIFIGLFSKADVLIAHNLEFDLAMLKRYHSIVPAEIWAAADHYCTKINSTDVLKLPPTEKMLAAQRRNPDWTPPGGWAKYKAPHLSEVYRYFFDRDIEGAHNAIVDVEACRDVFFELKKLEAKV